MNHDLVTILILDDPFNKKAGFGSDLVQNIFSKIKDMVGDKIAQGKDAPLETALDILTPALLAQMGFWKLSVLYSISSGVFGVDFVSIFKSIRQYITEAVTSSSTGQISKEQVNEAVEKSFPTTLKPNLSKLPEVLEKYNLNKQSEISIKITKQAINDAHEMGFYAYAEFVKTSGLESIGTFLISGLKSVLSFIVGCVMKATGLLLGSAVISGTAKTLGYDTPKTNVPLEVAPHKIKLEPSGWGTQKTNNGWSENVPVNSIKQTIISWAPEVYPELKNYPNFNSVANSSNFLNKVVSTIEKYNESSKTDDVATYIPPIFKSRKDIVDSFLGDVIGKL